MILNKPDRKGFRTSIVLCTRHSPKVELPLGVREIATHRATDRASNAEAIGQVLGAIDVPEGPIGKHELEELNNVLTADYGTAHALPAPEMVRHLAGILNTTIDPRRSVWNKWRNSTNFRVRLHHFDSQEIAVHAAPYTRGAGLLLWGFSCDTRIGHSGSFLIFLNTAHHPAAVTATMAHELGHYIYSSIASGRSEAVAALAGNFASHLQDKAELFSDSVVALAAYGTGTISKVQPRHGASPTGSKWIDEIKQAREGIHPRYRMDFARKGVGAQWQVRYLTATIHFFKLRKALLETAGI